MHMVVPVGLLLFTSELCTSLLSFALLVEPTPLSTLSTLVLLVSLALMPNCELRH